MKKVEAYIDSQFKKLPHTRTYREMKKNILLDCKDKYEEYFNLYGDNAEDKIIEEIGTANELYYGGLTLIDWLNLCSIVLIIIYLLFVLFTKELAIEISEKAFSVTEKVYGIPAYFIVVLPKYVTRVFISYVVSNLLFSSKLINVKKLTTHINDWILYLFTLILWCVIVFALSSFAVRGSFLFPHPLLIKYYLHSPFWQIFDIIFGILLGLCTSFTIVSVKQKWLSAKD